MEAFATKFNMQTKYRATQEIFVFVLPRIEFVFQTWTVKVVLHIQCSISAVSVQCQCDIRNMDGIQEEFFFTKQNKNILSGKCQKQVANSTKLTLN